MTDQKRAYIYALSAVLFWSTVASAFKISLRYMNYLQMLLYASIVSLVTLFILLIIQKKLSLLRLYSRKEYLLSMVFGLLNPFIYYVVLFKAYSLLPAQEAQPLNYTWSIMLVILSIPLLKQKIGIRSIGAIFISFFGVLVISTHGHILEFRFTSLWGVTLALGSSIFWALFWIYNIKDQRDEVIKLFLNFFFGFFYILIANLIFTEMIIPDIRGLLGVSYIGLFEMGITFVLWSKALKLSSTTARVGKLIYLSPFLSLVFIYFIVGEKILLSTVIGLILIVTGIVLEQFVRTTQGGARA